MKVVFILLVLVTVSSQQMLQVFDQWKQKYGIDYGNATVETIKRSIFEAHRVKALLHNANVFSTFKMDLNQFAAHTTQEFLNERCRLTRTKATSTPFSFLTSFLTLLRSLRFTRQSSARGVSPISQTKTPESIDHSQYTLSVLDQGACGSCWAFLSTAVVEARLIQANSEYNTLLSPQYLMDCDIVDAGCNGGWPTTALNWLRTSSLIFKYLGGGNVAPSIQTYPYVAMQTPSCMSSIFMPTVSLGIVSVIEEDLKGNENALKEIVAREGPVGIAVDVTNYFQLYSSGVLNDATADRTCAVVNHAVVITGYGTDPNFGDYWMVKNSWGTSYGENGYLRLARNKNNTNNLACFVFYVKMQ